MIEIENFVTRDKVEWAYGIVQRARKGKGMSIPTQGMRIARRRDTPEGAKLLKTLEQSANVLEHVAEEQSGRTRRDSSTPFAYKVEPTELSLMRAAYTTMDKGEPDEAFAWFYGMAGIIAGMVQ